MGTKTVSAAMLSLLCLPVGAQANDWTELRADATGSRASTEASGTSFSAAWTYTAKHGGKLLATPVSVDGLVIAAGTAGDLAAIGLQDGQERWSAVVSGGIGSTPAVRNGRIVTSTLDGQLTAVDLHSGATQWKRAFGSEMNYASPSIIDDANGGPGSVVLPSATKDVSRINLATGETEWCTEPGAVVDVMYTSAAVTGQQAIVGMNGGRYQSLDLQTGATRWIFNAVGQVYFASPLVVGDTVYMFPGDSKSQLFAAKVDNGQAVSGFPVAIPDPAPVPSNGMLGRGPATSAPMTVGGLIVFQMRRQDMQNNPDGSFKVAMREYVVAFDPSRMKIVWQHLVGSVVAPNVNGVPELNNCPTPAAFSTPTGPVLAVSSSIAARIAVLDVATGEERWSAPLSGPGRSSPIFSNGLLLVGTDMGVLHAFSSSVNHAPSTPAALSVGDATASGDVSVSWNAASDAEGQALSYVVRVTDDAAATSTETETSPGQTTLSFAPKASTAYHVSVRARDAQGALSASSTSQVVKGGAPVVSPPVVVTDVPAAIVPPMPADVVPMAPAAASVPAPACAPAAPTTTVATTTTAPVTPAEAPLPPSAPPAVAAAPTTADGPSVTILADVPAEPAATPAVEGNPAPSSPAMAMAIASPVQAMSLISMAHAPTTNDEGPALASSALASGCSVAGGSGNGATAGLALALLAVVLARKRNSSRN